MCAWLHVPPSQKSHIYWPPHLLLWRVPRSYREAVSSATVLILHQIKLNSQLSPCASFFSRHRCMIVHSSLLWSVYFCGICCSGPSFFSDFIWVFSIFFLVNITKYLSILFLFQSLTLGLVDLFCCLLASISFISTLIFAIFFPFANFGLCLFFFF